MDLLVEEQRRRGDGAVGRQGRIGVGGLSVDAIRGHIFQITYTNELLTKKVKVMHGVSYQVWIRFIVGPAICTCQSDFEW